MVIGHITANVNHWTAGRPYNSKR